MTFYNYGSQAALSVGDRVSTALHGRGSIKTYYRDRMIGWTYTVVLDSGRNDVVLIEARLTPLSAVDLLAELV